jgi:hypothetical protein
MTAIRMGGPISSQANIFAKCWYANVSLMYALNIMKQINKGWSGSTGSEQCIKTFGLGFEPHSWIFFRIINKHILPILLFEQILNTCSQESPLAIRHPRERFLL